jgi:hypothetical protein
LLQARSVEFGERQSSAALHWRVRQIILHLAAPPTRFFFLPRDE